MAANEMQGTKRLLVERDSSTGNCTLLVKTVAGSVSSGVASSIINVKDAAYGATGDGTTDDTAAFVAAIAAAGSQNTVYAPKGTYKIVSELLFSSNRVRFIGDGENITIFDFAPTAAGSFIRVSNGAALNVESVISGFSITSQDTTYKKVALDIWDVSEMQISDISIYGANSYWRGANSVGLRTQGREFTTIRNMTIFADMPIQISDNPNNAIDLDHFHFQDIYLGGYAGSAKPLITVDTGLNITDMTWDGAQAWVGGAGGFYMDDTTASSSSYGWTFKNVRTEQMQSAASWAFYIKKNDAIYNLRLENVYTDPATKGLYLRKVYTTTLDNFSFSGGGVALDYDGTNWGLDGRGCYFGAASTIVISEQNLVHAGPKYPATAPLPSSFRYHNANLLTTQTEFTSAGLSHHIVSVANNATVELGYATMKGILLITNSAGQSAIFSLAGSGAATVEMLDPASKYSITQTTASMTNISWVSLDARYELENKSGGTLTYSYMLLGAYEGF